MDVVGNDKEEVVSMIIQLTTKYDNVLEVTLDMADWGIDVGMFEYGIDCILADSVTKEVIVWLTQTNSFILIKRV